MIENDIRPEALQDKQREFLKKDIQWLLKHKNCFVEVNCPACEEPQHVLKYCKNGFTYVSCNQCKTFYMNPRPSLEILHNFYKQSVNYEYWNNVIFPASEEARRENIFKPRVDKVISLCKKFNTQNTSIIEVGAGFGIFCEEMNKRKYFDKVIAVEPTPDLAETCRLKGIETIELPIEKIRRREVYDVLVSFEVIEHLFSPREFLKNAKKLLTDKGLLILSCPNGLGFEVEALGRHSTTIDHEHLNYFNCHSLASLLEELEFEILEVETPGKLDAELVRKEILAGNVVLDDVFLKKILLEKWESAGSQFQSFLANTKQSSHMVITARKQTTIIGLEK
tara:strand:+ start:15108 stop:16118 length:1011 start_codon:yes stop_codon:yes gene_type:complete